MTSLSRPEAVCVASLGDFRRRLSPPFPVARPWWVAYSGGLDSTAVLMACVDMGLQVRAIHVNHHLQPAAADMQAHCERWCAAHDVPLDVLHVDVKCEGGDSLEAQARHARYAAIANHVRSICPQDDALVLTGHHRDDQLETVLIALFRGSGLEGLAGMSAVSALPVEAAEGIWLGRPLLELGRDAIAADAAARGWAWFDDPTNTDMRLRRNWIRQQGLPAIREQFPQVDASLLRLARQMADAREEWSQQASNLLQACEVRDANVQASQLPDAGLTNDNQTLRKRATSVLSQRVWLQMSEREQVRVLRYWLGQAGIRLSEVRTLELREQLSRPQGGVRKVADDWGVRIQSGVMRIVSSGKATGQGDDA
jgi:tRNA(Ile)-lysidine synthase